MNVCAVSGATGQQPPSASDVTMVNGSDQTSADDVIVLDDDDDVTETTSHDDDVTVVDKKPPRTESNGCLKVGKLDLDRFKNLVKKTVSDGTFKVSAEAKSLSKDSDKDVKTDDVTTKNNDVLKIDDVSSKSDGITANIDISVEIDDVTVENDDVAVTNNDGAVEKDGDIGKNNDAVVAVDGLSVKNKDVAVIGADEASGDVDDDVIMTDDTNGDVSVTNGSVVTNGNVGSHGGEKSPDVDNTEMKDDGEEQNKVDDAGDNILVEEDADKNSGDKNSDDVTKSDDVSGENDVDEDGDKNDSVVIINDSQTDENSDVIIAENDVKPSDQSEPVTEKPPSDDGHLVESMDMTESNEMSQESVGTESPKPVDIAKIDSPKQMDVTKTHSPKPVDTTKTDSPKPCDIAKTEFSKACDISKTESPKSCESTKSAKTGDITDCESNEKSDGKNADLQDSLIVIEGESEKIEDSEETQQAEDALLAEDEVKPSSRRSSVASVKSDILLESPPASPKPTSDLDKQDDVIVIDSQSRKRHVSTSSVGSDGGAAKRSRTMVESESPPPSVEKKHGGSETTNNTDTASEAGELLTVLSDEMIHALVRQKLSGLLAKEMDQVVAPLRKRISELQNTSDWWKDKAVNLQKQITDLDILKQRNEIKARKPMMRTVAVQVSTSLRTPVNKPATESTAPPPPNQTAPMPTTVNHSVSSVRQPAPLGASNLGPRIPASMTQRFTLRPVSSPTMRGPTPRRLTVSQLSQQHQQQQQQSRPTSVQSAVLNTPSSQNLQAFVISPPQSASSASTSGISTSTSQLVRTLGNCTVREMLSNRPPLTAPLAVSSTAVTHNVVPVNSLVTSNTAKPTTFKITSGNMVIDLTSEEDKKRAAGLVQSVVVPSTSLALQQPTGSQKQPILIGGNNVPVILQALNAPQVQSNQSILLTQANSNNVISIVPGTGLKAGGSAQILQAKTAPVTLTQQQTTVATAAAGAPVAAVPVALQRVPESSVTTAVRALKPTGKTMLTATPPVLVKHPAPLPPKTLSVNPCMSSKSEPPRPTLKISRVSQGIVLSWNMTLSPIHEEITNYQLYAYQEGSSPPSTSLWKKVGDVKALPLPMACTLTMFQEGNRYHFAVRAMDKEGRVGDFSDAASIFLARSGDST